MGKLVRTYTEKLENVINRGVDLRHQMRVRIESKDAIIRTQAIRIQQLEEQIETLKDDKRAKKLESAKAERELEINTPKYKNYYSVTRTRNNSPNVSNHGLKRGMVGYYLWS